MRNNNLMRGSEMRSQRRPPLLALLALLLCTLQQSAGSSRSKPSSSATSTSSPPEERSRDQLETPLTWVKQTKTSSYGNQGHQSVPSQSPKLEGVTGQAESSSINTGRSHISTAISAKSDSALSWSLEEGVSPLCAYRVIEGGIGRQLCFRKTLPAYQCQKGDCRTVLAAGNLVANVLINGSILLQWAHKGQSTTNQRDVKRTIMAPSLKKSWQPGANLTREERLRSDTVFGVRRHWQGGYELSCWWNGSYTQFECAGVHLGSGCRDFLLSELHENIPYRICLRSLTHLNPAHRAGQRDCVEFTLPPSGMQDIVIAMTTVGGAICVMLVIICLLVAYITENIMSPLTQHSYSYRTHLHH